MRLLLVSCSKVDVMSFLVVLIVFILMLLMLLCSILCIISVFIYMNVCGIFCNDS